MARPNHHSPRAQAHKAARHLDFHAEHDSIVKPPAKSRTIQAVRWTNLTPNLDKPFKRNSAVQLIA